MVPYVADVIHEYKNCTDDDKNYPHFFSKILDTISQDYTENITILAHGATALVSLITKINSKYRKLVLCNPLGSILTKDDNDSNSSSRGSPV